MRTRSLALCSLLIVLTVFSLPGCQKKKEGASGPVLENPGGGSSISGTITVEPKLAAKVETTDVLFVIAKSAEGGGGPPVAVGRYTDLKFPLHYSLSQENVMMSGLRFEGRVHISARISKSGDAMGQMGDLSGSYPGNPVSVGESGIDFAVTTVN